VWTWVAFAAVLVLLAGLFRGLGRAMRAVSGGSAVRSVDGEEQAHYDHLELPRQASARRDQPMPH
jgi:hypothetical protein